MCKRDTRFVVDMVVCTHYQLCRKKTSHLQCSLFMVAAEEQHLDRISATYPVALCSSRRRVPGSAEVSNYVRLGSETAGRFVLSFSALQYWILPTPRNLPVEIHNIDKQQPLANPRI